MDVTYFAERRDEMLHAIGQIVSFESPSTDKDLLNSMADHLAARFAALGSVERIANADGGDHLRITVAAPDAPAEAKPALVLCHFDTVWPEGTLADRPFTVDGDLAYGPGAYDMKTSFVLAEYALRAISTHGQSLPRPVILLFTSDEEIGSPSGRALIEETARNAAYVLVLEPPVEEVWALKTARKGGGGFNIDFHGRAAHAGVEPEKGASAITELAHQILAINSLNDYPQGTTLNVGVISGGSRSNVVAAFATLEVDTRAWTQAEVERVTTAIEGLTPITPGVSLSISGGFRRPPMERGPVTAALFAQAEAIGASLGLELREGSTGGGSDGNFTAALGVPTLDGLGTPGRGAHAEHEQVIIPAIAERAALLTNLLLKLKV